MPALLTHRVTNFQNVDAGTFLGPKSDNGHRGVAKDVEFWNLGFNTVDDPSSGSYDSPSRFVVTAAKSWSQSAGRGKMWYHILLAHVLHSDPSSCNKRARSVRDVRHIQPILLSDSPRTRKTRAGIHATYTNAVRKS